MPLSTLGDVLNSIMEDTSQKCQGLFQDIVTFLMQTLFSFIVSSLYLFILIYSLFIIIYSLFIILIY